MVRDQRLGATCERAGGESVRREESEVDCVRNRTLLALVISVTLAGALGGWLGAQLQIPDYTATAYVVVYRMPAGMTELISPDEAYNLQSIYEAGVFQDAVI